MAFSHLPCSYSSPVLLHAGLCFSLVPVPHLPNRPFCPQVTCVHYPPPLRSSLMAPLLGSWPAPLIPPTHTDLNLGFTYEKKKYVAFVTCFYDSGSFFNIVIFSSISFPVNVIFLYCWIKSHCVYILCTHFFIHSSVNKHLGFSHLVSLRCFLELLGKKILFS